MARPFPKKYQWRTLFTGSVILSAIDRFVQTVYGALQNGFFGTLFQSYPNASPEGTMKPIPMIAPIRRFAARTVAGSGILALLRRLFDFLLRCRLRVYGTFLLTFGVYTAFSFASGLLSAEGQAPTMTLVVALVSIGSGLPLLFSERSLAGALSSSVLAAPLLSFLGISSHSLRIKGTAGRSNIALVLGIAAGLSTFLLPPLLIPVGLLGLFLAYRVLVTPEVGVVALFFGMPFLPTMLLVALVAYTAMCYLIKWILGKRQLTLEAVDLAALAYAFCLFCGGVFSFSAGSRKPTMVLLAFLGGYFLTVWLIRTREWLTRCLWAALSAATLVSLYGILQYFTGSLNRANAWLDSNMFEDIAGRAISTLENPNMLAEYLILLLPMAAARLLTDRGAAGRTLSFFACASMGACVILTWSRGAWLGLLFGAFIFLLIWSRRTMYLMVVGVLSIPVLPLILPDSIVSRFTSIGNLADTSTSYRVNIWRGTVHMLEDYWMTGVGVGEAAWGTVYPRYSLAAIESAPHAHNLYLQTWVQLGIVGLVLLLAFLLLLLSSQFSYYSLLSRMRDSVRASVLVSHLQSEDPLRLGREITERDSTRVITAMRLEAAAPLCGILATLLQGLTDYTWYNYRVYLMFWLIAGLAVAYTRCGRADMDRITRATLTDPDDAKPTEAELSIALTPAPTQKG